MSGDSGVLWTLVAFALAMDEKRREDAACERWTVVVVVIWCLVMADRSKQRRAQDELGEEGAPALLP